MANFREPNIRAADLPGQMRQMISYLRQLVGELNHFASYAEKLGKTDTEQRADDKPPAALWPVGTVYRTVGENRPQSAFGGRWEQRADDGDEHVWVRIS